MRNGSQPPRSIAAEMALLFLSELEPRVAEDPQLLVSTEAVLSFAAIRHGDPLLWQHWRVILAKYDKSHLIEHMLGDPMRIDDGDWESKAVRLIRLALAIGVELFHDPDQHGWASVRVDDHWENYPIRSRAFRLFLLRAYYNDSGASPGGLAIRSALELFEARALFDGEECPVHLRVAEYQGKLYLDLSDPSWRAAEIDVDGWRIIERPPPRFRRSRGSLALPEPERGGSLDQLRQFLNVDHDGWTLIRAFVVAALRPGIPCPILVAKGEQGAGKSTACRVIGGLVDPRTAALRGEPREVRDLVAAAKNSWLVRFDNLSHLPEELADAACRLATGGGFGGRELYSDHEEAVFDATRPLVLNAIPDLGAVRPDFLDRVLIVEFPDIHPDRRRDERHFWREFEQARPRILGALLDAMVSGLRKLPEARVGPLPRMADFAIWGAACEEGLGIGKGEFLAQYEANRIAARDLALEASLLYEPLRELAKECFRGSGTELLNRLNHLVSDDVRRSRRWPKAPNALSGALRRLAGNLRSAGIDLDFNRPEHGGRRLISVGSARYDAKTSSPSSPSSPVSAAGNG